jgi:phosphoribosylanthranilate isomerase
MKSRIRVKMCGTTRSEDAHAAVSCGVDALGFIFAPKSPRYIEPHQAARIIGELPPFVSRVGVFVDEDIEQLRSTVDAAGLTAVQLHGQETADYCMELKRSSRSLGICKAFRIGQGAGPADFTAYSTGVDAFLLDTYVKGVAGGTGAVFDWKLVKQLSIPKPLILAGGLTTENVSEAIRVTTPYAIDINSGVEDRPGVKNHQLLEQLMNIVRNAEK